jgi:hypothetical protein
VADQTLLSAALVSSWLASGGEAPARRGGAPTQQPAQRAAGPAPAVAHAPPSGPALVERSFLAQCIALPTDGAERLLALDVDRVFSVPVHRRAARHLGRHAAAPADALPPDDPELEALIAELTLRAGGVVASRLALDAEALKLELAGIDRAIADARRAGAGGVGELTARRAVLLAEVDRAISAAMEEQQPSAP